MTAVNRRDFLRCTMMCPAALPAQPPSEQSQTFLAGLVPGGALGPPGAGGQRSPTGLPVGVQGASARLEGFWRACDECSRLGVHHIEVNNTNRGLMEAYEPRISEYREEMARRGLIMLGFAIYSHMHDATQQQELVSYHLRVARFLRAGGGKYIAHLLAPGPNLGDGEDDEYRNMDLKAAILNVNEVSKRVVEETGIRIGYHPEQGDIRAGIWERFLGSTNEKYFSFMPDIGHFVACGVDPLEVFKKYGTRMIGTHLRDYAPPAETGGRGRMVPFGSGVIKLPALVRHLRETKFVGAVMGEGGGNQAMHDYMAGTLKMTF